MKVGVITSSDKGYAGEREDTSGQKIVSVMEENGYEIARTVLLPDEKEMLAEAMIAMCDEGIPLILTTGGTGFSARDVMPEATRMVIERETPGIPNAILHYSLQITDRAMLSRATAGIRKDTLIVNLPGSPKAVEEALTYILPALQHGLDIMLGLDGECAREATKASDTEGVSAMKLIRTEDAVGQVLCHDITQIIRGVTKDAVFRKGHIVTEEDIPVLLSVGKEHLYVWENDDTMLHEDEAAAILYEICAGERMHGSEIKEGKIELIADVDGVFKIDRDRLFRLNSLGEIIIASRQGDFPVKKGDKLAGTRVIPLVIEKEKMEAAKQVAGGEPVFRILPIKKKKTGIVTTGSEVAKGRIEDTFTPVIRDKIGAFSCDVIDQIYVEDDRDAIADAILKEIDGGAEMVICTGGMSVDPDDRTPGAIRNIGARVITYGAPVLPGAMLLLAYYEKEGRQIPVLGLPGCVMFAKRTVFDLILPRILAEDEITKEEIAALGEGGLCLSCEVCTFPHCDFGK